VDNFVVNLNKSHKTYELHSLDQNFLYQQMQESARRNSEAFNGNGAPHPRLTALDNLDNISSRQTIGSELRPSIVSRRHRSLSQLNEEVAEISTLSPGRRRGLRRSSSLNKLASSLKAESNDSIDAGESYGASANSRIDVTPFPPAFTPSACHRRIAEYYKQEESAKQKWDCLADVQPHISEFNHRCLAGSPEDYRRAFIICLKVSQLICDHIEDVEGGLFVLGFFKFKK
jgi:hypothetical protein